MKRRLRDDWIQIQALEFKWMDGARKRSYSRALMEGTYAGGGNWGDSFGEEEQMVAEVQGHW